MLVFVLDGPGYIHLVPIFSMRAGAVTAAFEKALNSPETCYEKLVRAVFERKRALLEARRSSPAFSPYAECDVDVVQVAGAADNVNPVFSVLRRSPDGTDIVLALTNSAGTIQEVSIAAKRLGRAEPASLADLLSGQTHALEDGELSLFLKPYQVAWLKVGAEA